MSRGDFVNPGAFMKGIYNLTLMKICKFTALTLFTSKTNVSIALLYFSKYCKTMTRQQHNIKSNCVVFDDYCYDETDNYYSDINAMDKQEIAWFKKIFKCLLNKFIKI